MNIVDIILILILVLGAWTGFRRGLMESLAGLIGSVVGFIVALNYYPLLADWVNSNLHFATGLQAFFQKHLVLPAAIKQVQLNKIPLPELGNYLSKVNLPELLKYQLVEYIKSLEAGMRAQAQLGDIIYQFLGNAVVNAGAFLFIWFVIDSSIKLAALVIRKLTDNTLMAGFDHGGGLLIGAAVTFFTLTVLIGLVSPLLQVAKLAESTVLNGALKGLAESQLIPYFQEAFGFLSDRIAAFWL